ncbi:MAG: NAD-dependent epimerase/dehydratase family protein [Phycisphaerales bacterium]|nr:NAD-dependent epimerase/dehydratase family protein [Phycisphaerales bacterium]
MHQPKQFEIFRRGRAVVTGGAGFIGSHLVRALLDLECEVVVLDDLSSGHLHNVPDDERVRFVEASILDDDAVEDAVDDCRFVFHEAAMVSVPQSIEEADACAMINVVGTQRLLDAAVAAGVERFVFASSAAVYGDRPTLPSREDHPVRSCSPYAASKAAGEQLLMAASHAHGLSTASLRYFNVFGPRQDPKSAYAAVISAFTDVLTRGGRPRIFGDGTQTRDFVSVDNVVAANLLAASTDSPLRGEVLNIGTGARTSLLDLLGHMGRLLEVDATPSFEPPRAGDVPHSVADIARARAVLGYEPRTDLASGLGALLDWARETNAAS